MPLAARELADDDPWTPSSLPAHSRYRSARSILIGAVPTSSKKRITRRDVREADEGLRVRCDGVEVQEWDDLRRAVAAPHALDRVDLRIRERILDVARTDFRSSGVPSVLLERASSELDPVPWTPTSGSRARPQRASAVDLRA